MTEHLFAALYAAGIDDVMIEIDAEELPILDGSALEYITPLDPTPTIQGGMIIQREAIDLPLDLHITWLESSIKTLIRPPIDNAHALSQLQIHLTLELPPIKTQRATLLTIEDLYHRVIPAKTFGLLSDEEALRSQGLIKGVSHENTRVYDDTGEPLTPSMISSEAAHHKILDIIGDLYLLSRRPRGSLEVIRGSHRLNHKALYFIKPS